jgi:hypothetical protein
MRAIDSIFGPTKRPAGAGAAVTIRPAGPEDRPALAVLAALDSSPEPGGDVIVAEVGGELWAAQPVDGARGIADPFRPSGELAFLLAERARQLAA